MGRDFTAADNVAGAEKVTLIGYGMWQRDFGGKADIVGTSVRLNGKPATIIGVMPQGFAFPTNEELWIPLFNEFPPKPRTYPTANNPQVVGLIKRQVSLDQANAEATAFARRFAAAYPDTNKNFNAGQVQPLLETYLGKQLKATMWTMFAFCVGVLLIACVNVMNMQFARATLRAKELAIRSSLGAARARLGRGETAWLALLATVAIASHLSHLPLAMALLAVLAAFLGTEDLLIALHAVAGAVQAGGIAQGLEGRFLAGPEPAGLLGPGARQARLLGRAPATSEWRKARAQALQVHPHGEAAGQGQDPLALAVAQAHVGRALHGHGGLSPGTAGQRHAPA